LTLPEDAECQILSMDLCEPLITDPYSTLLTIWTGAQLLWIGLLVMAQYYQIARGITTHELTNLRKYGFMGGGNVTIEDRMQEGISSRLPPMSQAEGPPPGRFKKCLRILGVEQFLVTFRDKRQQAAEKRQGMNPFDQGSCWTNCTDFWSNPVVLNEEGQRDWLENGIGVRGMGFRLGKGGDAILGGQEVDYFSMFEVPEKRRKMRRLDDQYEAVTQVDEDVV
jgi:palmitoyltransferase ZDHHC13/17